jgi:F-type H+-transporting ATPase subunit delta
LRVSFSCDSERAGVRVEAQQNLCGNEQLAANQIISGVAGRYANALFDLATEAKAVPATAKSLSALQNMISGSTDLKRLIDSPVFKAEDQLSALTALSAKAGVTGLALNFVKLMCAKRRLPALSDAISGFQALVADAKGEMVAEVTSAEKLSAVQLKDLQAALKAKLGRDVTLQTTIDPSILGGLIVKAGTTMIDDSLKTKLQNLKVAMKGTG